MLKLHSPIFGMRIGTETFAHLWAKKEQKWNRPTDPKILKKQIIIILIYHIKVPKCDENIIFLQNIILMYILFSDGPIHIFHPPCPLNTSSTDLA